MTETFATSLWNTPICSTPICSTPICSMSIWSMPPTLGGAHVGLEPLQPAHADGESQWPAVKRNLQVRLAKGERRG